MFAQTLRSSRVDISLRSGSYVIAIDVEYRLKNIINKTRGSTHIHASFDIDRRNTGNGRVECRNVDREDHLAISAWRRALEILPYNREMFSGTKNGWRISSRVFKRFFML